MSVDTPEAAIRVANEWYDQHDARLVAHGEPLRRMSCWFVHGASRRYLETGDIRDTLVGSAGLVIDAATGDCTQVGSRPDGVEKQIDAYDAARSGGLSVDEARRSANDAYFR